MPPKKKTEPSDLDAVAPSLDDRLSALMSVSSKHAERWGLKDAVAIPAYEPAKFRRRVFSSGLLSLDQLIKVGGYPRGHIVEFYGPLSSGKSLALYKAISEAQHTCLNCEGRLDYTDKLDAKGKPVSKIVHMAIKGEMQEIVVPSRTSTCRSCGALDSGALCVLFDQENSVDPPWLKRQNVELTKIAVYKLPTGEHATEMLRSIMLTVKPDLIGIDSIAQLQPKTEQAKSEVDDSVMPGLHAKVMARLCRQVTSIFLMDPMNAPVFIWVNQMRADVSGNGKDVVTGGFAPEFYSALRIKFNASKMVNQQKAEQGTEGKLIIKKCKIAEGAKNRSIEYTLLDSGFDTVKDMYLTAIGSDVFLKSALGAGGHFWSEDVERANKLATSRDGALNRLREDPEFADEVRRRVYANMALEAVPDVYIGPPLEEPMEYTPSDEDTID